MKRIFLLVLLKTTFFSYSSDLGIDSISSQQTKNGIKISTEGTHKKVYFVAKLTINDQNTKYIYITDHDSIGSSLSIQQLEKTSTIKQKKHEDKILVILYRKFLEENMSTTNPDSQQQDNSPDSCCCIQ